MGNRPTSPLIDAKPQFNLQSIIDDFIIKVTTAENPKMGAITVIDEKLRVRKSQLEVLVAQVEQAHKDVDSKVSLKSATLYQLESDIKKSKLSLSTLEASIANRKSELAQLKEHLEDSKEQIRDRRAYLNEQEAIIGEAIEAGNERLKAKKIEMDQAATNKEAILRQIFTLRSELNILTNEKTDMARGVLVLKSEYESSSKISQKALNELRDQEAKTATTIREANLELDQRLQACEIKEKELEVRKQVYDKLNADLQGRERRLQSRQRLYNS